MGGSIHGDFDIFDEHGSVRVDIQKVKSPSIALIMEADQKASEAGLTMKFDQSYNGCKRNRIKGQREESGPIVDYPYDSCTLKQ